MGGQDDPTQDDHFEKPENFNLREGDGIRRKGDSDKSTCVLSSKLKIHVAETYNFDLTLTV